MVVVVAWVCVVWCCTVVSVVTLHGLSQWRETEAKVIKEFLGTFHVIRDVHEILKFSREMFHSFFGLLAVADKYESVHENVFRALLHCISLLNDKNVKAARVVLRTYIDSIFCEPTVYLTLVRLTTKVLANARSAADTIPETVRLLCTGFHTICKFVVKSRELNLTTSGSKPVCDEKTYKSEIQKMFTALHGIISLTESKSEHLKPAQSALVTSLPIALKVLKGAVTNSGSAGGAATTSTSTTDSKTDSKSGGSIIPGTGFAPAELGGLAKGVLTAVPVCLV